MVAFASDQVEELRALFGEIGVAEEGGTAFFHLKTLGLPPGCTPGTVEALLCPSARDGYPSRLYFGTQIASSRPPNWTQPARILERNWYVFSWRLPGENLRLAQIIQGHLQALR